MIVYLIQREREREREAKNPKGDINITGPFSQNQIFRNAENHITSDCVRYLLKTEYPVIHKTDTTDPYQ